MADVFQMLQDEIIAGSRNADLFLATVANVNSSGLTLILDGESEASTKRYKYMTSGYADPAAGDRVVVMKMSGTFVVLGRIGSSPKTTDGKVSRSGDIMTGNLTLANSQITQINQDFNLVTHPSSNLGKLFAILRDVSSRYYGRIRGVHRTSGEAGVELGAIREAGGTTYYNGVTFYLGDDGSPRVYLDFPAEWRKVLGLGTNGALPITIAQGGTGQTGLITTSNISEIITAASGFTVTEAYYAQFGKVATVYALIQSNNGVTTNDWTTWATIVSGKRPGTNIVMGCTRTSYCSLGSSGNIMVSSTVSAGVNHLFSATYLLP